MHVSQPNFNIDIFSTYHHGLYYHSLDVMHNGFGVWGDSGGFDFWGLARLNSLSFGRLLVFDLLRHACMVPLVLSFLVALVLFAKMAMTSRGIRMKVTLTVRHDIPSIVTHNSFFLPWVYNTNIRSESFYRFNTESTFNL